MIFTERNITIRNDSATINAPVILYRGDKNVEVRFILIESPYKYSNRDSINIFESTDASYAQLVIKTPNDREPIFGDITAVGNNNVTFVIRHDMIDEIEEVGAYDFQIRLFDADQTSMATTPEVRGGFIIKEPIAKEDSSNNITNSATVGSAVVTNDLEIPTFVGGSYNKKAWNDGDVISKQKLNKMEDGIYETYELSKDNSSQIKEKMNKNTTDISINQINKNYGLIDQSFLSEELKQQIAGTAPINSVPAIGSITQSMMARPYLEGKKSKNLFCPDTATTGKYVYYQDGTLVNSDNYMVSDYIPVEANRKITLSGNHQQYALFDINKEYVAGDINEKDPKVITPTVNGFIRININIDEGELSTTQLELGNEATEYEDYYKIYLDNNTIKDRIPREKLDQSLLTGRKSSNLFNKNDIVNGVFINMANGKEATNSDYVSSNYIPVKASKVYCVRLKGAGSQGAFYDEDRQYISGVNIEYTNNFIAPSNACYFRFGFPSTDLKGQMFAQTDNITNFEKYGQGYLDESTIGDDLKTLFASDLSRKSLNLFNKNTITNGVFINMANGKEATNSDYVSSNYIPVNEGNTYCVRLRTRGAQGAFYDINRQYISGVNIEYTNNFVAPTNAHYFRFGFPKDELEEQMFVQGDRIISFEAYGESYLNPARIGDDTKKLFLGEKKGVITVAKENGDFDNIQSAIDNAGDSSDNPVTILIYPGVYSKFTVIGGRNISLIGIDKHKCIVRDDYGRYDDPPAEIHVNGLVKNLTFISTHDLDTETNVDSLRSYAVHCDYAGEATVEFEDCIMISKQNASFGSGLHNNVTIKLTRCELYSETPTESTMTVNGALFCHSNTNSSTVNQNLIVKDCIIKSKNSYAAYINEVGSGSTMKVTFINNMIWSDELKKSNQAIHIDAPATGISGNITLTEESYGNNISLLNN